MIKMSCPDCEAVRDVEDVHIAAQEAYAAKYEAVTPDFVRSLRKKYNASQKAFGLILGMGELTINSYETGKAVPSSTNRLLLQPV